MILWPLISFYIINNIFKAYVLHFLPEDYKVKLCIMRNKYYQGQTVHKIAIDRIKDADRQK